MGTEGDEHIQKNVVIHLPSASGEMVMEEGTGKRGAPGVSAAHKLGSACNSIYCESSTQSTYSLFIYAFVYCSHRAMGM